MTTLQTFESDCTFNQAKLLERKESFGSFHCLDLSSATDRFPMSLQTSILSMLVSPQYAEAWNSIMVKLPFTLPKGSSKESVNYNTGQPMGAYSSWAMFSLSHHLVVQYSANQAGYALPYTGYALLGDDIVIGDTDVAEIYKATISGLGVDFSIPKSHEGQILCDFAKRL